MKNNGNKKVLNILVLILAIIVFYMSTNGLLNNEVLYMSIILAILVLINLIYIGDKKQLSNYIFIVLNIIGIFIFSYLIIVEHQLKVR